MAAMWNGGGQEASLWLTAALWHVAQPLSGMASYAQEATGMLAVAKAPWENQEGFAMIKGRRKTPPILAPSNIKSSHSIGEAGRADALRVVGIWWQSKKWQLDEAHHKWQNLD